MLLAAAWLQVQIFVFKISSIFLKRNYPSSGTPQTSTMMAVNAICNRALRHAVTRPDVTVLQTYYDHKLALQRGAGFPVSRLRRVRGRGNLIPTHPESTF